MASKRHRRQKVCGTKKRHTTRDEAWAHIRSLYDGSKAVRGLAVYRCEFCGMLHVGHGKARRR